MTGPDPVASPTRAVAVGGGHGLARSLRATAMVAEHVTAVVSVGDDGGSSGRLRRDLGVAPPGDLRMALTALARNGDLAELAAHRFPRGELAGHSLGNLMLVSAQELADGDLVAAVDRLVRLLDVPGRVLPCSTSPVTLHARSGGREVTGQAEIALTPDLERVWLQPAAPVATPGVVEELGRADLVVLGPGSLYTSLLPNLLVPEIGAAVTEAPGTVVFVGNLSEQPRETEGLALHDHLDALHRHVPSLGIDVVVVHDGAPPPEREAPLVPDVRALETRAGRVVVADLAAPDGGHDPHALAAALRAAVGAARDDV